MAEGVSSCATLTDPVVTIRSRGERPESNCVLRLFRHNAPLTDTQLLLEEEDLSAHNLRRFCLGSSEERKTPEIQVEYRKIRIEKYKLCKQLKDGIARLDLSGRFVLISTDPPAVDLPPPPVPIAPIGNNRENRMGLMIDDNNVLMDDDDNNPNMAADEQEWLQQQEAEAAAAIARAAHRYRAQGVEENVLTLIPALPTPERPNLTFRRICIAVASICAAFVFLMTQTLPLWRKDVPRRRMDSLVAELFHVKIFGDHAARCTDLSRENKATTFDNIAAILRLHLHKEQDCGDGVLHIPSQEEAIKVLQTTNSQQAASNLEPFVTKGFSHSWWFPCVSPPNPRVYLQCLDPDKRIWPPPGMFSRATNASDAIPLCFRGVHDDVLDEKDVARAVELGSSLISEGGDHFDIHDSTTLLHHRLPAIVERLSNLLVRQYNISHQTQPVAFRVNAIGPMDGTNVLFGSKSTSPLVSLLNITNYKRWVEKVADKSERRLVSVPWPLQVKPTRDVCHLLSDMEIDPTFNVLTSVFLSEAGGQDYRGGATLYADSHRSNRRPRTKMRRGLSIGVSKGRAVVSTGGSENLRCRLPIRSGVRAVLQIWWAAVDA